MSVLFDFAFWKIGYFGQFGEYAHFSGANHHSPRQNDAVETLRCLIPGFNVRNDTVGDCYRNFSALHDVLRQKRITGWICGTGNMGRWFCEEAEKLGLRIPEDLAVIGFDGDYNVGYMNPPLTTVEQPLEDFGCAAVQFLLRKLEDPSETLSLIMAPRLVERGTT